MSFFNKPLYCIYNIQAISAAAPNKAAYRAGRMPEAAAVI